MPNKIALNKYIRPGLLGEEIKALGSFTILNVSEGVNGNDGYVVFESPTATQQDVQTVINNHNPNGKTVEETKQSAEQTDVSSAIQTLKSGYAAATPLEKAIIVILRAIVRRMMRIE